MLITTPQNIYAQLLGNFLLIFRGFLAQFAHNLRKLRANCVQISCNLYIFRVILAHFSAIFV